MIESTRMTDELLSAANEIDAYSRGERQLDLDPQTAQAMRDAVEKLQELELEIERTVLPLAAWLFDKSVDDHEYRRRAMKVMLRD